MDELTQYYYSIYPGLVSAMEAEGIDPRWAGVVAPQVMIETSWGKSPATKYHNYFGMKAAKNQNGVTFSTNEGYGDDTIRIRDSFLAFPSREEGLRQGVRRLRDKFNAFEGKPSTEQYVKNINSNPEQIYFTGNPEDYINNINKIKNGSRAKAAIKQYAKDVRNAFLEAQSDIPNSSEDSRIEKPQPIFTPRGDVRKAMQDKVDYHNFMNSISIQNNPQPVYNPPIKFDDGGELYHPKQWNDLTMAEKAEMMKVAVQNGITTLPEIREKYNEFATGGYIPSDRIKDRITHYEGKAMTGAIDPLSGKYSKNNSFESEAKGFYNALPEDIRDQVLSNPELADSLYSYSYNVGAGNFKKRVIPTLRRYYQGKATVSDIEKSMWASGDSKLRGLQRRRAEERAGVRSALAGNNPIYPTVSSDSESLPFTPFYNEVFNTPLSSYNVPTVTLPIEEPLVQAAEDYAYSKAALDRQERQDRLNAFNMLLSMSNPNSSGNSLMDTVGMLTGRNFAQGGRKYDGLTQNNQQMVNPYKPNGGFYYINSEGQVVNPTFRDTIELPEAVVVAKHNSPDWYNREVVQDWDNNGNRVTYEGIQPLVMSATEWARSHSANDLHKMDPYGEIPWNGAAIATGLLAGEVATPFVTKGAETLFNTGVNVVAKGKRFAQDVGDRYQGMKDAAAFRDANGNMDARTIANMQWWGNGGTPTGINRMGISNNGNFGIYYLDDSRVEHSFYPTIEKGGNMTLTTHLGGGIQGELSENVLPMSKSEKVALAKYLEGAPRYTYLGEAGRTKNYAEQYFNEEPSKMRAFKDAIYKKKEANEPYWNGEELLESIKIEDNPIEKEYLKHLYGANEPLSTDSYKLILQEVAKNNGKFSLRYDSSPMGMFSPQGVYEKEFYNSLLNIKPKEQVDVINRWMKKLYPKARPAYLENEKVMIPRPLLMLKNKK